MRGLILMLASAIICFISCATPKDIPTPSAYKSMVHGLKIEVKFREPTTRVLKGELISVDGDRLLILTDSPFQIQSVIKKNVGGIEFTVARLADAEFKIANLIGAITLSHGWFFPITFLINYGSIRSVKKATYKMRVSPSFPWDKMHKFARFPQGLPYAVTPNELIEGAY